MNANAPGNDDQRARLSRVVATIKDLRAQVDALKQARSEPIAIVGLGCRYPGNVEDADSFWQLLRDGRDAIREVPPDRWDAQAYYAADPDSPGKICTRFGGFVDGVDRFDPYFFGMAPREACSLDPQQRLLLEVGWEALEHAGLAADRLRGSRMGVFVGISSNEYAHLLLGGGADRIDSYMGSGNAHGVAAGRLSYVLGLHGPALAVDTACSSSLVAVHLACQSLRLGECDTALAGGVNVMLTPTISINHSRARMLAPDGRCKTFDARADGFVRSEGCGLVVLKRLSAALADGDVIAAVIRGSATNQDGHTSGLTVPSGPAQQKVIRDALAFAGVSPAEISYVEAHGTGTALGDPIELNALAAVLGERPKERPLLVGSVKTNIGHAEAAAGIAGLLKVVLALEYESIPPHLHVHKPTPTIDWDTMPVVVPGSAVPWPRGPTPRLAGVSSFGFGGTNAHIVLSDWPAAAERAATVERPLHMLALSAQSDEALAALTARHEAYLAHHAEQSVADICHTANTGRSHLRHRLCAVARSGDELERKLGGFRAGQAVPGLISGKIDSVPPRIAFAMTGQGAQYPGMGRELFDTHPEFRRQLERCDALLGPELGRSLIDLLYAGTADDVLDQTLYTQPTLFALEYCLGSLWISWGVVPDLLIGHSLGEYVAACLAGVFSLEDGLRLVAARARLMHAVASDGAMAAVLDTESNVRAVITSLAPDLSVAAVNGLQHVVVAGARPDLERLLAHFTASGVESFRLKVSQAFHSALVEPMLADLEQSAATLTLSPPRIDIISNLTGGIADADMMRPDYWSRHARQPVRFFDGMRTLEQQGITAVVEIGPHPVLIGMGRRCIAGDDIAWLPSLRRGQGDWQTMLESLAGLHVRGTPVDWRAFDAPYVRRRLRLPTYPFQRQRYWIPALQQMAPAMSAPAAPDARVHPLLGERLPRELRPDHIVFESKLTARKHPLLDDHRVFGAAIMPASGMIEIALAAGAAVLGPSRISLRDMAFHRPLRVPDDAPLIVQTSLQGSPSDGYEVSVHSRPHDRGAEPAPEWTLHASGLLKIEVASDAARQDMAALRGRVTEPVATDEFYAAYARRGIAFGAALRAVQQLHRGDGEALGRICLPESAGRDERYRLHPVWLDACAQLLGAAVPARDATCLQAAIRGARIYQQPDGAAWAHARVCPSGHGAWTADLRLLDDDGRLLAEVTGLTVRKVDAASFRSAALSPSTIELFELRWHPRPPVVTAALPEPAAIAAELHQQLERATDDVALVAYADALAGLDARVPGYVGDALRQLGWRYQVGQTFTADEIRTSLAIAPRHEGLLTRLLAILQAHGTLRRVDSGWELAAGLPKRAPITAADGAQTAARTELALLDRCGSQLADVLSGRCDPLQLLFADGERSAAEAIYRDSSGAAALHGLLRTAIRRLQQGRAADRPLRVLEVGAGTGGATAHVLPELPAGTEYVFTDISAGFFLQARVRFANHRFVRYQPLDIERAPQEQGFAGQQFDVVIAFNVLHATRCLRETITHVQELLADGGLLLLLENTEPAPWVDLIWGLTPGWWRFTDHDLRPSYPLLTAEQWRSFLAATGFDSVETIAVDPQRHEILARQALVVARKAAGFGRAADQGGRTWLVLSDETGIGDEVAALLETRGHHAVRAQRGSHFARIGAARFALRPTAPEDFSRLLAELADVPLAGVIDAWGLDAGQDDLTAASLMSEAILTSQAAVCLVQALAAAGLRHRVAVWLVTRGAQAPDENDTPVISQAPLWGIGKAIAREHPELWGGMLDLDPAARRNDAAEILREVCCPDGEDHIALRGGRRRVARLAACHLAPGKAIAVRADGTYLITGGCGALGLATAGWLVEQGCRHLALLGRRGAATVAAQEAIAGLECRGATVKVFRADVADEAAMKLVLADIAASGAALRGVIHAAGLPGRSTLVDLDPAALEQIFAAKVAGTWILHSLTRGMSLDLFVCFSSMVSIWGAREQCHYVAANHFLDMFAHFRRAIGLPALCVNWGPLSGGGMLPPDEVSDLGRIGVSVTPLDQATRDLGTLLRSNATQAAAVAIDWPLFREVYQSRGPCRMFDTIRDAVTARTADAPPAPAESPGPDMRAQLRSAPESERREILLGHLQSTVGQVLQFEPGRRMDAQQGFFDMGMDSLTAMELRKRLETSLGVRLPPTLVFDYGTPVALADFLLRDKLEQAPAIVAPMPAPEDRGSSTREMMERLSEEEATVLLEAKLATL